MKKTPKEEALKTLKENLCNICSYHAKNMDSCDIGYCDNRAAIRTLEKETKESKDIHLPLYKVGDRIEPGTDGNAYKLYMSNGKEFEQQSSEDCVSRKAVFETIDDCNSDGLKGIFCSYDDGERFKEYIKKLSSVTPKGVTVTDFADICRECGKQKKGEWIKHNTGHSIYYDCSLCSCVAPCTETADKILWKLSNFCPDCGAKMSGIPTESKNKVGWSSLENVRNKVEKE